MRSSVLFSCIMLVSASTAYNTCGNCQVSSDHISHESWPLMNLQFGEKKDNLDFHNDLFQAVVVSFSHHLTTLASIELQKISLEWNLCRHLPIAQVAKSSYEPSIFPGVWLLLWGAELLGSTCETVLAWLLWPRGVFPLHLMYLASQYPVLFKASWTCGNVCLAPEDQGLACSECEAGLQLSLQQLSNQEVSSLH